MSLLTPPQIPLFRINLFYGPEELEGASQIIHCVFNVKKRSWKGGVQVGIEVKKSQLDDLARQCNYQSWLKEVLKGVPDENCEEYRQKAQDLLIQLICFYKLQECIHQGIQQKNVQVGPDRLVRETEEAVCRDMEDIKRQILVELDLCTE